MHEVSLVQGLMEQVRQIAAENHAGAVTRIKVLIGPFSGVVLDSFSFAFEALSREDGLFRQSRLEIDAPGPVFRCRSCGTRVEDEETAGSDQEFRRQGLFAMRKCPSCGKEELVPDGGDEILLVQVEMEQADV